MEMFTIFGPESPGSVCVCVCAFFNFGYFYHKKTQFSPWFSRMKTENIEIGKIESVLPLASACQLEIVYQRNGISGGDQYLLLGRRHGAAFSFGS